MSDDYEQGRDSHDQDLTYENEQSMVTIPLKEYDKLKEQGQVVYVVTVYISPDYQMAAIAETPTSPDLCVLFRTFDLQLNPNLVKPGLTL